MLAPGQKSSSHFHAAGGDPDIVNRYFNPFLLQGQKDNSVFFGHIGCYIYHFYLQLIYDLAKFPLVELPPSSFHETIIQFPNNDGGDEERFAMGGQCFDDLEAAFGVIAINIGV